MRVCMNACTRVCQLTIQNYPIEYLAWLHYFRPEPDWTRYHFKWLCATLVNTQDYAEHVSSYISTSCVDNIMPTTLVKRFLNLEALDQWSGMAHVDTSSFAGIQIRPGNEIDYKAARYRLRLRYITAAKMQYRAKLDSFQLFKSPNAVGKEKFFKVLILHFSTFGLRAEL